MPEEPLGGARAAAGAAAKLKKGEAVSRELAQASAGIARHPIEDS